MVLFITARDALSRAWPVGLTQGKFRVEYRGAAKKAHISRNLGNVSLYPAAAKSVGSVTLDGMPLEDFLTRVRSFIQEEKTHDPH